MIGDVQKYSSGWRGAPAKGIDGLRRARVQIPPSALMERNEKKFLTSEKTRDNINELRLTKSYKKKWKSSWQQLVGCDKILELLQERNKNNFKKVEKSSWQAGNNMI